MRVVVAGGAGFLGSHLTDALLERGDEVVVVDDFVTGSPDNVAHLSSHDGFELVEQDVTRPFEIDGPIDAVMNLASPASPKDYHQMPLETLAVGSTGTRNLLELALGADARFFMASTSEVYGDPHVHPQTESYWGNVNPIGERSMYDEAKRFSEALTFAYHRTCSLPVRVVRIFNTYGPRMQVDDGRVVSNFIVQGLRGEPLTIYGDGSQTRSFCYVEDEVRGFLALLDSDVVGPVNIGNPGEFTMLELAEIVTELTGSDAGIVFEPLPADDPKQRRPDITIATEQLGWAPEVDLRTGLERTIPYFAGVLGDVVG
ncbi:UDP-glucuronic acid decarboxylase family protein [Ilumatobacter sp.]|uniref:UDP-glucuronic acid decarboxylase family protein n=1 Tax=Ilumatobacter sp. TaxID=1967498 RepID=UPI003B521673